MTVIEVGIVKSGLPIYIKNFTKKKKVSNDDDSEILRSAFLSAIQTSIAVSFESASDDFEIKLKNHIILLTEIKEYTFYAVANKNSKFLFPIKESVKKLANNINLDQLHDFDVLFNKNLIEPTLLDIFKDLILTPSERVKRAF